MKGCSVCNYCIVHVVNPIQCTPLSICQTRKCAVFHGAVQEFWGIFLWSCELCVIGCFRGIFDIKIKWLECFKEWFTQNHLSLWFFHRTQNETFSRMFMQLFSIQWKWMGTGAVELKKNSKTPKKSTLKQSYVLFSKTFDVVWLLLCEEQTKILSLSTKKIPPPQLFPHIQILHTTIGLWSHLKWLSGNHSQIESWNVQIFNH